MAIVAPLLLAIAIGCCTYQKEKKRKKKRKWKEEIKETRGLLPL
jgi:hypothetical protein